MYSLAIEVKRHKYFDMLMYAYLDDAMLQVPFSQVKRLEKRRLPEGDEGSGW